MKASYRFIILLTSLVLLLSCSDKNETDIPEYQETIYVINKDTGEWDFGFLYHKYLTLCRCINGQYYQFYQRDLTYENSYYTYIVDKDNRLVLEGNDRISYRYYTKNGQIYVWYFNDKKEVEWFTVSDYGLDMVFDRSNYNRSKALSKSAKNDFSISDFYTELGEKIKGIGSGEVYFKPLIFDENGKMTNVYRGEINRNSTIGSGFAASGSQEITGIGLAAYLEEPAEDFFDEDDNDIEESISAKKEFARITSIHKNSAKLEKGRVYFDITVTAELLIDLDELKSCRLWLAEDDATNPSQKYENFHIENDIDYWPNTSYEFKVKISVPIEDFRPYNGTLRIIPEPHLQLNIYKTDDYTLYKTAPVLLNLQYDYNSGVKK